MSDTLAVSRYARALFELADQQGILQAALASLEEVARAVKRHPEISHLVLNSTIGSQEKEDFIEKVFPSDSDKLVVQFLKVLIQKRRFDQLHEISEEFKRLVYQKQGIKQVRVITAVPLSRENEERLLEKLKQCLKAEIQLTPEVREEILGGIILQYEGTEINGSFRSRLQNVHRQLFS